MSVVGRYGRFVVLGASIVLVLAAGCTGDSGGPGGNAPGGAQPAGPPLEVNVTPKSGTKNLPISSEIGVSVTGGTVQSVVLTKTGSTKEIAGTLRDDKSSWVPAQPLAYSSSYEATVTAVGTDGKTTKSSSAKFTTMGQPGRETDTGLYLFNGTTYGVAMPVVIQFDPPVADSARAGIQKRLFVTTTPSQPGVWHWASGSQVWYRPPTYWQTGTKISVRAALKGVPMGGGSYGDTDRSANVTIAAHKVIMNVDNHTKMMTVYKDDTKVRTIPVSLGKPSTPSSSGTMVVMSHDYQYRFDTRGEPNGGYVVDVNYAMRLTWGGEFIHAAPWSVYDQGHRNVSHGCVNVSMSNAAWLFGITHIGDLVNVKGTEVKLVNGNGWTAWNISWPEFVKGSALPVPADLANWTPQSAQSAAPATPAPAPTVAATTQPPR